MGGELREWRDCKLGDVLELKRGYDLPSQHRHPGPVPIVSSSGPSGFHSEAMVKAPGVVTGRYGTIGEVFFVTQDFWPLNTTLYVRDFKGSDPKFVSYFLKTIDFYSCSDKAAVPGVNRNHLHELPVRVPPLAEQRAIARVLGTLDDKIELNRKMNATLEAMARALFKSWFVDFDPVRAKAEGRAPSGMAAETAKLFPSEFVQSEPGPIPKGWRLVPFLDVADLLSGGTPKTSVPDYWNGGIKWASAKDVSQCGSFFLVDTERTITTQGLERSATKIIPAGAVVVVARGATCGRFTVFAEDMAMNQTCYALAPKTSHARWYLRFLADDLLVRLVAQAHGSVFDTITTRTFERARTIDPGPAVLKLFETHVSPVVERIRSLHYESVALATLRDALLPRLLSGELSVTQAARTMEATA